MPSSSAPIWQGFHDFVSMIFDVQFAEFRKDPDRRMRFFLDSGKETYQVPSEEF